MSTLFLDSKLQPSAYPVTTLKAYEAITEQFKSESLSLGSSFPGLDNSYNTIFSVPNCQICTWLSKLDKPTEHESLFKAISIDVFNVSSLRDKSSSQPSNLPSSPSQKEEILC